jgi:hypothetical protein
MSASVITEREVGLPVAELLPGTSTTVKAFGTTVAIFNVEGQLFAPSNRSFQPLRRAVGLLELALDVEAVKVSKKKIRDELSEVVK